MKCHICNYETMSFGYFQEHMYQCIADRAADEARKKRLLEEATSKAQSMIGELIHLHDIEDGMIEYDAALVKDVRECQDEMSEALSDHCHEHGLTKLFNMYLNSDY